MWKHPPSCVCAFAVPPPEELRRLIQGDYGDSTTVFGLRCPCGADRFEVALPADGYGTVSTKCVQCGSKTTIFDAAKHGYDGAVGNNRGAEFGPHLPFQCPKCKSSPFRLAAGFQYAGETDILEEYDLDIEPEDLFGWFVLCGLCTSCRGPNLLTEYECA